jgi:DNA-binding LacI/PurR family transcriptional regulator
MTESGRFPNPQPSTLRSQTAAIIKEAILGGQWLGHLPSEVELCRLLKVGRVTVRSAVMDLVAQNLIIPGGKGRNHTIIAPPASVLAARRVAKPTRIIRYLSNEPFHHLGEFTTMLVNAAEAKLGERGYNLVFEHEPGLYARFSMARLEKIASRPNTSGWILFRTTRQIQSWFQEMRIPTLITGSPHSGVSLPAVRIDYSAACSDAALQFLKRGHRCIAFVTPAERIASEEESVQGFLSTRPQSPDVRFSLIEHDGTMPSLIQGILASRLGKEPVTGYLIMEPAVAVTTLTILQSSGISVPGGASIISRFGDSLSSRVLPTIAHYRFDGKMAGRLTAKAMQSCIEQGHLDGKANESGVAFHEFVAGGSLGRL